MTQRMFARHDRRDQSAISGKADGQKGREKHGSLPEMLQFKVATLPKQEEHIALRDAGVVLLDMERVGRRSSRCAVSFRCRFCEDSGHVHRDLSFLIRALLLWWISFGRATVLNARLNRQNGSGGNIMFPKENKTVAEQQKTCHEQKRPQTGIVGRIILLLGEKLDCRGFTMFRFGSPEDKFHAIRLRGSSIAFRFARLALFLV